MNFCCLCGSLYHKTTDCPWNKGETKWKLFIGTKKRKDQ